MNYEQELNNLRNAQKNAAVADLQKTRDTSLSNLQAEEAQIKPTYAAQRSTANAQNRIAARNFQEYLANTGRANSGIGAQYEMSRQNSLQNGLNAINAAEAQSIADIARRRNDVQNAYNTGIAGANAQVEANYINNLLAQRQQQWERDFAQKQFDESVRQYNQNRLDQLNRAFSSGGGRSSSGSRSGGSGKTAKTTSAKSLGNQVANIVNDRTTPANANNNANDYTVSSVMTPKLSTTNASKWVARNLPSNMSRDLLDRRIALALETGDITKADANKIYASYGIK